MKKRKILYLIPFAALVLSGCTFQEGWEKTTGWLGDNIWTPVKEFFEGLFGGGGNKKQDQDEEGEDDPTPTPTPTPTPATPKHAGTLADPYDAADAKLMGSTVESGEYTPNAYYIKGEVQEITEEFDASYGSYTFMIEDGFKGYRMKNGESKAKFSEGDIEVGDEVLMYGPIQRFKDTYELSGTQAGQAYVVSVTKPAPTEADLESLRIEGEAQSLYAPGVAYNHNGLSAIAVYEDGVEQDVTSSAVWTISKATAAVGDTTIKITATFKTVSDSIDVAVTVSSDPVHAGTLEDPLDGADACLIASQLQESDKNNKYPSAKKYYIKGVVQELLEEFNSEYGNFTFTIENGFEGYRLKNGSEKAKFTSADDLVVGNTVTIYSDVLNFHGTYETNDGYIYSIEKEVVPVESVAFTEAGPLSMELGTASAVHTLTANVLPANASNKNLTWSSSEPSVASVENGVVTALTAGQTVITATAADGSGQYASITVNVSEATKTLLGISLSGTPKSAYVQDEAFSAEGLVVTATYDQGEPEVITNLATFEFNIGQTPVTTASLENDGQTLTIVALFESHNDSVDVVLSVSEEHGTLAHPYSVSEAYAEFQKLADGATTGEVYVKGYIQASPKPLVSNGRGQLYLTDGVCATDLYLYNVNNVGGTNDLTAADLPVGGYVVASGVIKNYGGTFEVCWVQDSVDCKLAQAVTAPTITSVGTVTAPASVGLNGNINPANVSVEVVYNNIVHASVVATNVTGDFSSVGEATAYATIDGWQDTIPFTVTVESGQVLVETEIYKLDGTITATGNAYATATTLTQDGVSWDVTANTEMNPWRIGGKSITAVDRPVQSNAAVTTDDVTKVAVDIGATASSLTLNSVTLKVGTSAGASDISTETKTSNITSAVVEFERPANTSWASRYFTVVFNVTRTSSSGNGYVLLNAISFYAMK